MHGNAQAGSVNQWEREHGPEPAFANKFPARNGQCLNILHMAECTYEEEI